MGDLIGFKSFLLSCHLLSPIVYNSEMCRGGWRSWLGTLLPSSSVQHFSMFPLCLSIIKHIREALQWEEGFTSSLQVLNFNLKNKKPAEKVWSRTGSVEEEKEIERITAIPKHRTIHQQNCLDHNDHLMLKQICITKVLTSQPLPSEAHHEHTERSSGNVMAWGLLCCFSIWWLTLIDRAINPALYQTTVEENTCPSMCDLKKRAAKFLRSDEKDASQLITNVY